MMKQAGGLGGKGAMDPEMMADLVKKMGGMSGMKTDKDGNPDFDIGAMTGMMSEMMKQMGGGNMASTKERLKKKLEEKKGKK